MEDRAVPNVARSRASAPSRGNAHLEMIEFNGTTYSLCLLDTNVVSEIVKRPREVGLRFLERFGYGPREGFPLFPVVSPYTVAEVLQRGDVTERFAEVFGALPLGVLHNWDSLWRMEVECYHTGERVPPLMSSISVLRPPAGMTHDP